MSNFVAMQSNVSIDQLPFLYYSNIIGGLIRLEFPSMHQTERQRQKMKKEWKTVK
jgi:hypothetical protein